MIKINWDKAYRRKINDQHLIILWKLSSGRLDLINEFHKGTKPYNELVASGFIEENKSRVTLTTKAKNFLRGLQETKIEDSTIELANRLKQVYINCGLGEHVGKETEIMTNLQWLLSSSFIPPVMDVEGYSDLESVTALYLKTKYDKNGSYFKDFGGEERPVFKKLSTFIASYNKFASNPKLSDSDLLYSFCQVNGLDFFDFCEKASLRTKNVKWLKKVGELSAHVPRLKSTPSKMYFGSKEQTFQTIADCQKMYFDSIKKLNT